MRRKRITAFLLIFILCINLFSGFINPKQTAYANTPSPYRYRLVVAYFEYWQQADGVFKWQDSQGVVHTIGKGNPDSYLVSNYTFPVALMPGNYEIEKIMNYNQYTGSWADLNYTGGIDKTEIDKHYMHSAVITNSNALIGQKNTTVSFTASFYPLGTNRAKKMSETVYRSYIAIVIKYVDSAYKENPIQWEIDNGLRTDNVTASLTGTHPTQLTWNYKEFERNQKQRLDIALDATGSTSGFPITNYNFSLQVVGQNFTENNSNGRYIKSIDIYPNHIGHFSSIPIQASVVVTNNRGKTGTANYFSQAVKQIINEKPDAYFMNTAKPYAKVNMNLDDYSSDPEDDLAYKEWKIRNAGGNIILIAQIYPQNSSSNNIWYSPTYFSSAKL